MPVVAAGGEVPHHVPAVLVGGGEHVRDVPALVHQRVVALAQQGSVVDVAEPTINPVHDVVRFGPRGGRGAAGVGAPPVAAQQPPPLRPGEQAHHPAEVEVFPGGAEHVGDEVSLTRQAPQHLRREHRPGRGGPEDLAAAGACLQILKAHDHVHGMRGPGGAVRAAVLVLSLIHI